MKSATYWFEGICVDTSRMSVTREGLAVPLEPKALDVLLFLIEHRDRLVTKDELLDAVWKDTFVTPNVLTRAVAQLRKALGDDADEPRIIETASKRGYRFVAEVRADEPPASPGVGAQSAEPLPAPPPPTPSPGGRLRTGLLIGGAVVVLLVAAAVYWGNRPGPDVPSGGLATGALKRISTRGGFNGFPALSPDGQRLAYVSDASGSLEIYVRGLATTGTEYQLTSSGGQDKEPAWSPDGNWIAFHSRERGGVWVVPSTGGSARQVADFGGSPAWAPDSDRLVFSSGSGGFNEQAELWTVRRDGTERTQLTDRSSVPGGAISPSWSHNGKLIVFTNSGAAGELRMWLLSLADRRIHSLPSRHRAPVFGPGDRWIYAVVLTEGLNYFLGRVPIDPDTGDQRGNSEMLVPVNASVNGLSIAADGTLVYSLDSGDDNLWKIDVSPSGLASEPVRVTTDDVRSNRPAYSTAGVIAYQQLTTGHPVGTWLLDEHGKAESLLPDGEAANPEFSSDGRRLLVLRQGRPAWIDLTTRAATPAGPALDSMWFPRLAPNDAEVAFHLIGDDGHMRTWVRGLNEPTPHLVAEDAEGVGFPVWSPDGRRLAVEVKRGDNTYIGLVPRSGGAPIDMLVTDAGNNWPNSWSRDGRYIAFAGERKGVWNVWTVNVATRETRQLTHFTVPIGYVRYPVWSPRGDRIIFERAIQSAAIWAVKVE